MINSYGKDLQLGERCVGSSVLAWQMVRKGMERWWQTNLGGRDWVMQELPIWYTRAFLFY